MKGMSKIIRFKRKIKAKVIIISLLVFLLVYVLAAILPYIKHKDVSDKLKNSFSVDNYYSDSVGTERVQYVTDNVDAMVYRIQMVNEAEDEIIMSTFDFFDDNSGKDMMSVLINAANRGVKVKILADGNTHLFRMKGNTWFKALGSHKNIEIKIYNTINVAQPWEFQARMHDKYLIIDDKMYLLGGRNTSDLFLGDYESRKNIDRELFVYETKQDENSSLNQVKDYFEFVWISNDTKDFNAGKKTKKIDDATSTLIERYDTLIDIYPQAFGDKPDWFEQTVEANKVTLIHNPINASNKEPEAWYALNQLMLDGDKVTINTPYIICGKEMYEDLENLADTTDLSIITNDTVSGANPWGCTDYMNQKKKILGMGITVYEFSGDRSSHTKTITIDDRMSIVGSFNMDMRSTYLDTEFMLAVDSEQLSEIMKTETENYISYSREVKAESEDVVGENFVEHKMSFGKKIIYPILRVIIRPIRWLL